MKHKVFISVLLILSVVTLNVFAVTVDKADISIDPPMDFVVITSDSLDENEEFINGLNYTKSQFADKMNRSDIVLFSADRENKKQITVCCNETDFSKGLGNMSVVTDEYLGTVANSITGDSNVAYTVYENDGTKFINFSSVLTSSQGKSVCDQYVTVKNGKIYTVSFSVSGDTVSEDEKNANLEVMKTVKITDKKNVSANDVENITTTIVLSVLILGLIVFSGYLLFTLVRDIIIKRQSPDQCDNKFTIKRRKFK